MNICKVAECPKPYYLVKKGYCNQHYKQIRTHGTITSVGNIREPRKAIVEDNIAKIPLGVNAKDGYAIVDKEFAWVDKYNWHTNSNGYAMSQIDGSKVFLHHLITPRVRGKITDHINRNRLNNTRLNLRNVDYFVNSHNSGVSKRNKSGIKGISWDTTREKWAVEFTRFGERYRLGRFDNFQEAVNARSKAEKQYA